MYIHVSHSRSERMFAGMAAVIPLVYREVNPMPYYPLHPFLNRNYGAFSSAHLQPFHLFLHTPLICRQLHTVLDTSCSSTRKHGQARIVLNKSVPHTRISACSTLERLQWA